jgi:hypothetical protein
MLISKQLAQDEEGGFEIASFGLSESDEEEEGLQPNGSNAKGANARGRDSEDDGLGEVRGLSPVPPKPMNDRRSLDGETIFAVGEEDGEGDDKFSDDEGSGEERERLTKGH